MRCTMWKHSEISAGSTWGVSAYPPEIRRVIYTTNASESLNMSLTRL